MRPKGERKWDLRRTEVEAEGGQKLRPKGERKWGLKEVGPKEGGEVVAKVKKNN